MTASSTDLKIATGHTENAEKEPDDNSMSLQETQSRPSESTVAKSAKSTRLHDLAARIKQLPTLPTVYIRVAELMRAENSSAADIAQVVRNDQVITAKLLRVVNSSFYGFKQHITTISRAITVIGFRGLRDLILTLSAFRLVRPWSAGKTFDDRTFWAHAVGCASCARATATMLGSADPEEAFTAALLHDIGKLAQYWFLRDEFVSLIWKAQEMNEPLFRLERDALGFTHADLGRLLAERWKLPDSLVDSIAYHHAPAASHFRRKTAIVHFADIVSRAMLLGGEDRERVPPLDATAWQETGLKKDRIEPLMRATAEEFEKGREFLAIVGDA